MGDGVKGIAGDTVGEGGQIAKDVVKSVASIATGIGGAMKGDVPKTSEEIQALKDAEQAKSQAQAAAVKKRMMTLKTTVKPVTQQTSQVPKLPSPPKQLPQLSRRIEPPASAKRQWAEMKGNKGSG